MFTNPYLQKLNALQAEFDRIAKSHRICASDQAWFKSFDVELAREDVKRIKGQEFEKQRIRYEGEINHRRLVAEVSQLQDSASIGIDPRHWFSSERAIAKRMLTRAVQELGELERAQKYHAAAVALDDGIVERHEADIRRYLEFDSLRASSQIHGQQVELDILKPQIVEQTRLKNALDEKIRPLLEAYDSDDRLIAKLEKELARAQEMEAAMANADGRYRAYIHQQCGQEFRESSPGRVVSDRVNMLKRPRAQNAKRTSRIQEIIESATRVITHIVIDGNNLCYGEHNKFIGLSALEALVPLLAPQYKVTLIFDASIRSMMRSNDEAIRSRFPQDLTVHVVASSVKADELILNEANDAGTYVISRDRYSDFPEKSAVREKRVIRHEILNGKIHITPLDIAAAYSAEQY